MNQSGCRSLSDDPSPPLSKSYNASRPTHTVCSQRRISEFSPPTCTVSSSWMPTRWKEDLCPWLLYAAIGITMCYTRHLESTVIICGIVVQYSCYIGSYETAIYARYCSCVINLLELKLLEPIEISSYFAIQRLTDSIVRQTRMWPIGSSDKWTINAMLKSY